MPELKTRLHWLMGLRVVVVTLMLGLSLAFQATRGELAPPSPSLIILTYSSPSCTPLLLRHLTAPRSLTVFTWVQVGMDFVLETILVARTGGIESPFAVLYVITVTVASLVPHRRVGLVTGAGCTLLFGMVTIVQFVGLLPSSAGCRRASLRDLKHCKPSGCMAWRFWSSDVEWRARRQLRRADQSYGRRNGASRLQVFHESIVRSISSGVFTADEAGRITSFNPAAHEVTGYAFSEVQGAPGGGVQLASQRNDGGRRDDVDGTSVRFEVEC